LAESPSSEAEERLRSVESTQDGFALAEKDLEMRGPGEFLGLRQSGMPDLQMANLGDVSLLKLAREEAQRLFRGDPNLDEPKHRLLRQQLLSRAPTDPDGEPS
jgi:ATP-dependent DNA helicase RecG